MKYHINLVSRHEMTAVERILYFFLNYVRYILVITQLTVIGVLFFRFKIDQSIIDLKESIDQKKEIIKVFEPSFKEATKVNTQLTAIQKVVNEQTLQSESLQYLMSRFPRDVFLQRLDMNGQAYSLVGSTGNSQILQDYYSILQREKKFKDVELTNIKREETGYSFTLKVSNYTP